MKKILEFLFHRVILVAVLMLVQIAILCVVIVGFSNYFVYFYAIMMILSAFLMVRIINDTINPAYKIAWLIPVLLIPIFGGMLYLIFATDALKPNERVSLNDTLADATASMSNNEASSLFQLDEQAASQSNYIYNASSWPLVKNTATKYYPTGEAMFHDMLELLKKAQRYIFLEYFIVQTGVMWNAILEILEQKVQEGVDVRLLYDDMGCLFTLPKHYHQTLIQKGIKCCKFNALTPELSSRFNNRDHHKICAIDGHTALTGGINLADEYINAYEKHGHWKDAGLLLQGEGAFSMTLMFLILWRYTSHEKEDFSLFLPKPETLCQFTGKGYVHPFDDSPLDQETVGETVYINMIYQAKDYVFINTPYLIITHEMEIALCTAAKRGVDVRIVTPHIPDKWYVHAVTRSYYERLIKSGVSIYEYTPGFIHSKTFLVDDDIGVVGTINLDYRSLYLHFECAVWMYQTDCLLTLKQDFEETLYVCTPITLDDCRNTYWYIRLGRSILGVFAPLM